MLLPDNSGLDKTKLLRLAMRLSLSIGFLMLGIKVLA
jgi:hypothetical protein